RARRRRGREDRRMLVFEIGPLRHGARALGRCFRRFRCFRLDERSALLVVSLGLLERLEELAHGITARRRDSKRVTTPVSSESAKPAAATASANMDVLANQCDRRLGADDDRPNVKRPRCVGRPSSMYSIVSLTWDRSIRRDWSAWPNSRQWSPGMLSTRG